MNKRKLYRNVTILASCLAVILVITLVVQVITLSVANGKTKELEEKVAFLTKEISALDDEIEYKNSLMYIEKYAREQLGLYGADDVVFIPES